MRQSSSNSLQLISSFHPLPVCIPHPAPSSLPLPNPSLLLLLMFSLCSPLQIYFWLNWVTLHNFKVPCTHHLHINLACLSVRLYPINVKRLKRSGPNFVWDLTWPQGRFMNDQNLKKLFLKVFYFCKNILNLEYPRNSLLFQCLQSEHVYNWNRRRARSALKA